MLGHNGCGKSTLAKHFNAILLPSGRQRPRSTGWTRKDEALLLEIRQAVGMVFQNPDNQIVANVVEEDVAFAPENLGVPREEIRRRVDDGAEDRSACMNTARMRRICCPADRSSASPSRVCIAMQPKCIVLDEPTAMLDPAGPHARCMRDRPSG